ncbi:MAG: TetR family transcriptional regulator [Aureliella sp.]
MSWKRARSSDQKAERIDAILEAAATLFDEKDFLDISMRDVAEQAGLGKASLYHYFKTKEEVFISLYRIELEDWKADALKRLRRIRTPNPERVAKLLTDALRDRPRFCRLTVVFSSVLERNLSVEFIREFKMSLLEPLEQFSIAMMESLDGMTESSIQDFLMQYHALVAGLWPLAHPSPEVAAILEEPEFVGLRTDFFRLFECTLRQILTEAAK